MFITKFYAFNEQNNQMVNTKPVLFLLALTFHCLQIDGTVKIAQCSSVQLGDNVLGGVHMQSSILTAKLLDQIATP